VEGKILRYTVKEGAAVASGDTIIIMECMKMEIEIQATAAGVVHFLAQIGTTVPSGRRIAEIA
jgi:oxaloacetate decarboxylase alpha subunit